MKFSLQYLDHDDDDDDDDDDDTGTSLDFDSALFLWTSFATTIVSCSFFSHIT
jgi:hypothetical protein